MGLYKGGLYTGAYIRGGGLIHGRSFVLVINKSDINKSVINKSIINRKILKYVLITRFD